MNDPVAGCPGFAPGGSNLANREDEEEEKS